MNITKIAVLMLLSGMIGLADDYAERVKLIGVWESQGAGKSGVWNIKDDGENLHLVYTEGSQKLADFECNTLGKDCKAKVFGHESTISLYFNGGKLVEMETRGSEVLKRRFGMAAQGDQMEVELIPLSGSAKPETQQYKRVQVATAQSH